MLLKAAHDYNIDLSNSWMIGDTKTDILAGKNAGCLTALVSHNYEEFDQDVTLTSLNNIIEVLQDENKKEK